MVDGEIFHKVCRICGSEGNGILIYSEEGKSTCLEEKIRKFLSITVSEEDLLPKMVCLGCSCKLSEINSFAVMANEMQLKLLERLNSMPCDSECNSGEVPSDEKENEVEGNDDTSSTSDEGRGSLLHSILTNGLPSSSDDVTRLEVTLDPMLFLEEDDDDSLKPDDSLDSPPDIQAESSTPQEVKTIRGNAVLLMATRPGDFKPYQCTLCRRGYNSDLGLKNHMWSHLQYPKRLLQAQATATPAQPQRGLRFECSECNRIYPTMSTLRAHQVTHSDLRPHKCHLCDKTFKRNQDLKFHINQHTGERPYRCPYCPKAFASSGNCFSHRKRMHPKQLARDKKLRQAKLKYH